MVSQRAVARYRRAQGCLTGWSLMARPLLVVVFIEDPRFSLRSAGAMVETVPGADLVTINGAGHGGPSFMPMRSPKGCWNSWRGGCDDVCRIGLATRGGGVDVRRSRP